MARTAGLEQVDVRDRLIFDAEQFGAVFGFDGSGCCGWTSGPICSCCGGAGAQPPATLGKQRAGKIWSAEGFAREPQ